MINSPLMVPSSPALTITQNSSSNYSSKPHKRKSSISNGGNSGNGNNSTSSSSYYTAPSPLSTKHTNQILYGPDSSNTTPSLGSLFSNSGNNTLPLSDPLDLDDNDISRNLNQKLKPNNIKYQKQQQQQQQHRGGELLEENTMNNHYYNSNEEEEYHDTNSDLGFLTVNSKEDLIVCLNVLKKEIYQFKNLSKSLLGRLTSLERGVGDEKSLRSSPITTSQQQFLNSDEMTFLNSPNSQSPNSISPSSSYQSQYLNSNIMPNSRNTEILLSNAINEIHRLIEKQKQYDNILSQREKIWDDELNKLTMSILSKFPSNRTSTTSTTTTSSNNSIEQLHDLENESPFSSYLNESNEMYIEHKQNSPKQNRLNDSNGINNTGDSGDNEEKHLVNGKMRLIDKLSIQLNKVYSYLFGRGKQSISFWKKVIIISIIIIVWPFIAQLLWRFVKYLISKRNGSIDQKKILNNSLKSNKLKNITNSTTNNSSVISEKIRQSSGILSRFFSKRNSPIPIGLENHSSSSNSNTLRAPDIVNAIIKGASTGEDMNNVLSSVLPSSSSSLPLSGSNLSPSSSSAIPIIPALSSSSNTTSNLLSPINSTSSSNLMNNLTPTAISSLALPSSTSNLGNTLLPPSGGNIHSNNLINNHNNRSQSNSVMFNMVKNLLNQKRN